MGYGGGGIGMRRKKRGGMGAGGGIRRKAAWAVGTKKKADGKAGQPQRPQPRQ